MLQSDVVEFKLEEEQAKKRELTVVDTIEQYGPAADLKVADIKGDNNPHIYMLNASGSGKSYLRIIKQGLRIKEVSTVKYQKALNLWSLKSNLED